MTSFKMYNRTFTTTKKQTESRIVIELLFPSFNCETMVCLTLSMCLLECVDNQSVGRRSIGAGTARVKSHVIRAQNASKLGEKA